MTRLTLALLLTLLAIAPVASVAGVGGTATPLAAGQGGDAPAATTERSGTVVTIQANNTTRRLDITAAGRSNYSTPGMDLASTVAVTGQRIDQGLRFEYLSVRVERAGSAARRRAIADAEVERLNQAISELRDREWAVLLAYGNGEISERELLHRLAVIHSSASTIGAAATQLEEDGADFNADDLRRRAGELQTPIRAQVSEALSGQADTPVRVHVRGSEAGLVLQALSESRFSRDYYREAIRFDNYEEGANTYSLNEFLDLLNSRYPYATTFDADLDETTDGTNVYVNSHDQGDIRLYNDGRTEAIYREYQSLRLSDLPRGGVETVTENGTTVSMQLTPNGGPAKLVATNALTGDAVPAEVYVDGELVGQTGGGGSIWILQPSDEYTVTVETPDGTVVLQRPASTTNATVAA
ncbi:DUF7096 domain-containing protein [Haloarchaeobius iranensis]|uniref:Uncharacterized protein n=1 Tax=Haloarchaeobius iranensis TaxID=996166 RepID=A0A1G9VFS6_9EURY|nr:hypothetical protein [Haloarchaeobius iranensis]SDM70907.1 hypothetical protein SAMN05192554_10684 [Haloarchaeobius iranensis]